MFGFRPHCMHTSTPLGLWKAHNTMIYSVLRSRQFYLSALCRAETCARTRTKAYNTPTNIRKFPLNGKYLHLFFNETHHSFNKNLHGRDFYRFSANISMRKKCINRQISTISIPENSSPTFRNSFERKALSPCSSCQVLL